MEQIVDDSIFGSREATLAYSTTSILEHISSEVSKINVPTLVVAGELDQLDSIERHKREVGSHLPPALRRYQGKRHLIQIDESVHGEAYCR